MTISEAAENLLEVLSVYFGLAVPLKGEEAEFNQAENDVAKAYQALVVELRRVRVEKV